MASWGKVVRHSCGDFAAIRQHNQGCANSIEFWGFEFWVQVLGFEFWVLVLRFECWVLGFEF